jgi:predicted unusual protein kinase regulating ubiquinone biosynthesis (AarF/ABC1/UbiB family)
VMHDTRTLFKALVQLGLLDADADLAALERDLKPLLEGMASLTKGKGFEFDIPVAVRDIEHLVYGQPFHIPVQFAFLGRAIGTLLGVVKGLAPDADLNEITAPAAKTVLGSGAESAKQVLQELLQQVLETGRDLLSLPSSLERVLMKIETEQVEVRLADQSGRRHSRKRGRRSGSGVVRGTGSDGLAWAGMGVVLVVGGTMLTMVHLFPAGWFCLGLAALSMVGLLGRR